MTENIKDAILPILKKIQDDNAAFRKEMAGFRKEVTDRFDHLDKVSGKQRRASAGMLVMMRATAGEFEERVSEIEERMVALEQQGS